MHYDMDAFYASIEINRNPKLKNKPLVVGENIVTTASYEARKYGIHSAMKVSDAKLLCPKLIAIPVDKKEYIRISNEIHNLILKITNKVEFIATDEGYIDLTGIVKPENKIQFALKFKERIKELTNGVKASLELLDSLVDNTIIRLNADLVLHRDVLTKAIEKVNEHFKNAEKMTLAEFRDITGSSRKYSMAILEYIDKLGITRRVENYRVLVKNK